MLLADLVACATDVAATSSRNDKIEALAALLHRAGASETATATRLLAGDPRQGRIGVGWATVATLSAGSAPVPSLTTTDLDRTLDEVAACSGEGSATTRIDLLNGLLSRATAAESDYVMRLLTGELRQGASEGVVVEAVARAGNVPAVEVRRALMLTGDLGETSAIAMTAGRDGLQAVEFQPMRPVRPMLASTAEDAGSAVTDLGMCSVEWKLDGVRVQAHRVGTKVGVWTRNLNEVTARLGDVAGTVRGLAANQLALDGEVMGLTEELSPAMFQDTMGRLGTSRPPAVDSTSNADEAENEVEDEADHDADDLTPLQLAVMFFDVLHVDGRDLLDEPLVVRLEQLAEIAPHHRVPGIITNDPDKAEQVFAEAVKAGHEGVMVKAADARYAAGRRGKAWRKVKPVHRLDLVVLAVEPGSGRRKGWLSNIHLGARHPDGGFVMVGKTFKGMTDEMLAWQTERFEQLAVSRQQHVVELRHTQVVEIAIDGVQRSTRYPGGVALRFARVLRYRSDKPAENADTIDKVRALMGRQLVL